jgi:hypothetical protein
MLVEICDTDLRTKFKQCDNILRKLKTKSAKDHVLHMLENYEDVVTYDPFLQCYIVKERYMVYYSKRLKNFKYTCQCTWRSYHTSICGHVAVIIIHNILTFGKDLVEQYLIYVEAKRKYRKLLRYRTPKFLTKY